MFLSDRGGFREWHRGPRALSIFCNHLFFCNNFEEVQTALFEVKLITNNAPSTYAYPNTIETCYTQSFVICLTVIIFFNTSSTVLRNVTVLLSTTDKMNRFST